MYFINKFLTQSKQYSVVLFQNLDLLKEGLCSFCPDCDNRDFKVKWSWKGRSISPAVGTECIHCHNKKKYELAPLWSELSGKISMVHALIMFGTIATGSTLSQVISTDQILTQSLYDRLMDCSASWVLKKLERAIIMINSFLIYQI